MRNSIQFKVLEGEPSGETSGDIWRDIWRHLETSGGRLARDVWRRLETSETFCETSGDAWRDIWRDVWRRFATAYFSLVISMFHHNRGHIFSNKFHCAYPLSTYFSLFNFTHHPQRLEWKRCPRVRWNLEISKEKYAGADNGNWNRNGKRWSLGNKMKLKRNRWWRWLWKVLFLYSFAFYHCSWQPIFPL